jgi:hypothetical protein
MENIKLTKNFFWFVDKEEMSASGQVYLGAFIATSIFAAFYMQNVLFIVIVLVCSLFIFLSKNKSQNKEICSLEKDFIFYENKIYEYENLKSYSFIEELWGKKMYILILQNKNILEPVVFIPVDKNVEISKICAIIPKSLKEEKSPSLTLVDKVMLRFFV